MRMNGISNHAEYHEDSLTPGNILMLKEKIISTDQLIRSYNAERETNEKHASKVNELLKTVDQLNKECIKYENQLSESLREIHPYKESAKELQDQNSKYIQQISDLQNKLAAGEKLTQQYEALLKSKEEQKDQDYVEKDEMDKQIGKREKEIRLIKERLTKVNEKLHDRITRSQKLLKGYNTSVRHLLKFGKKLTKQKSVSKVDQKIIDYYRNIISKHKNNNESDDNELDISQLSEENEESHAELSDNSFEIVEERIISSPYKSTPMKSSSEEFCSPSPKRKCNESSVLTPHKSSMEGMPCEPEKLLQDSTGSYQPSIGTVLTAVNSPVQVRTQDTEITEPTIVNLGVDDCMPIINDIYPETAYSNSEKSFMDDAAESSNEQTEINVAESPKISNKEIYVFEKIQQIEQYEQCTNELYENESLDNTQLIQNNANCKKTYNTLKQGSYSEAAKIIECDYKEDSLNPNVMEPGTCNNQGSILNEIEKAALWNETSNTITDDADNMHKEMEEEIARITYDMCKEVNFHLLSPLPPTPPPRHTDNRNFNEINASPVCNNEDNRDNKRSKHSNINNSQKKKQKRKLDFTTNINTQENANLFDGATEHTNGTQKLHHQHSQGFEVLPDDTNYSNPNENNQHSHSGQQQNQSRGTTSIAGSSFNNTPPQITQNPEPLQQPFQANILHCPVDGNFKINIRLANLPNERRDHKITSLNLEVNNITREFNISCSRIPCEYSSSSSTETAKCPCCANNLREQSSNVHQIAETGSFLRSDHVQMDANVLTRVQSTRVGIKPITSSPSKPVCRTPEACKSKKHSERHDKIRNINITEDPYCIPSDMDVESIQEPSASVFEKSHKTDDVNRSSSVANVSSYIPFPASKGLEASSPNRQKAHNILPYKEQSQVSSESKNTPCVEPTKPPLIKQNYSIQDTANVIQTKPSPSKKQSENVIQNASCIKQTKPPLSKQKSVPYMEQTKATSMIKQKGHDPPQVALSTEFPKFVTAKKDIGEIFPISRKLTSNKRLLSEADGEGSTTDSRRETGQVVHVSKKSKLNTKADPMSVGYDSIVDHFSKLGRNIFDVKSSVPKTMEEIQKLKQGSSVNKASLRKLQLKLANPHHILSTDTFVQSALVFLANTQQNPFINFSSVVSPPLLTDFEKNLLALLQFLETKGYNHLRNLTMGLKIALSACIFNRTKHHTLFGTASMCRTYVALCRQSGELEEARLLCYDLFCKLPDSALFLVTSAISVWPDILIMEQSASTETSNKRDLLQSVYTYLLLKGSHTLNTTLFGQCRTVLKILCKISSPFNDIITLGKHIIETYEEIYEEEIRDTCTETKFKYNEASMAIELLAIQAGLISQLKEFFDDMFIPTFNKWREQLVQKTKKYEILITFWLKVFSAIGHHCFQIEKHYFENLMKLICELLVSVEASFTVQESAFTSLLTLQPLCNQSYLENISNWLLEHEQNLSDDGKAFIEKIKLKSILATLPRKEQLV